MSWYHVSLTSQVCTCRNRSLWSLSWHWELWPLGTHTWHPDRKIGKNSKKFLVVGYPRVFLIETVSPLLLEHAEKPSLAIITMSIVQLSHDPLRCWQVGLLWHHHGVKRWGHCVDQFFHSKFCFRCFFEQSLVKESRPAQWSFKTWFLWRKDQSQGLQNQSLG